MVVSISAKILFWLDFVKSEGCSACNKKIFTSPMTLEFLISRSLLPNYNSINDYRMSKIFKSIEENNRVLVFSSNVHDDISRLFNKRYKSYSNLINHEIDFEETENLNDLALALQFKTNTFDYLLTDRDSLFDISKNKSHLFNKFLLNTYDKLNGMSETKAFIKSLTREDSSVCMNEKYFSDLIKISKVLL